MATTKIKMSDEDLVAYIKSCYKEADDSYTADIKPNSDECWDLYRIYRDYSDKKDWQTKHVNPRAFAAVEIATALVKKSLVFVRDFFTVKGQESRDIEKEKFVKELLLFWVRKSKFFIKFAEGLKIAFISGLGILKIYWRRWEEEITTIHTVYDDIPVTIFGVEMPMLTRKVPRREEVIRTIKKSELVVESVDPALIRIDPFSKISKKPKYVIELEEIDYSTLLGLETEGFYGEDAGGVNISVLQETRTLDKAGEKYQQTSVEVPESGREMMKGSGQGEIPTAEKMPERKSIVLWKFHGDIEVEKEINDKKVQVYQNWEVTLANGEHIIRKKKNPHSHGKYPYVFIPCIVVPFRFYPMGIVEPIKTSLAYSDDLHNMAMDNLKLDLMGMYGADMDSLEDPQNDLEVEPGNFIKFKSSGMINAKEAIQPLITKTSNLSEAMNMIQYLDRIIQIASGVMDPTMGMLAKGDQTATEFRGTLSQSTIKFEAIARDIEEIALNPAIEMIFQTVIQNMDPGMWLEITGDQGDPLAEYVTAEKIEGNYDFYVGAITGYLSQLDYISKIVTIFTTMVQAAQVLALTPEEARKVFKKVITAHGLPDVAEILNDVPIMNPMMMGMGAGGPQPGGGTTPGMSPEAPQQQNMNPVNVMQMLNKPPMA